MVNKTDEWKNKLYFGDNLPILRDKDNFPNECVDLIYLDPPFNSKATYNILFAEKNGSQSSAQITAFGDTWHWGKDSAETYYEIVEKGPKALADLILALRSFLGQNDMMAYLVMMAVRLSELHRVLKPTGSIYLHCDSTANHYLKILLDGIFGIQNFENDIIWNYGPKATQHSGHFQRKHDTILFYSKTADFIFNPLLQDYSEGSLAERKTRYKYEDEAGRYRLTTRRDSSGNKYRAKVYLQEGVMAHDVWDIGIINSTANERLGYPTQKPEALLERIINASSNEGDLVLDPFCGCGTTVAVAERLKRKWIGIDITHLAITLMKNRLETTFIPDELTPYEIIGVPVDSESAQALALQDRYQFEWWALSLIGARPAQDKKKGSDKGIDGYIYFRDDNSGLIKKIVVQVKSGNVGTSQIRDFQRVVDREKAVIGAFITLQSPTSKMTQEIQTGTSEDYYISPAYGPQFKFAKIQILTIQGLLSGREKLEYPRLLDDTFKQAERKYKEDAPIQPGLHDVE